ncbi:heme exporter protein C [Modestobacter sp. DSM 44400]|uniref:cytochrome c biogenesis protein CcsA n=1 Tax=Modestobacter sp. DSM 44400 TaxID=1550230 RepID=UPI0008955F5D|nr:cytochrome c biogenesis protein CcsA [Modestobacter sp. DSM 44400]SDY66145.1 heme exporter protein C [Modestobacter sp. DSM 44400]
MAVEPGLRPPRVWLRRAVGLGAGVATLAMLILALWVAPPDAVQGQPQRLMYLHVPAAWVAYLAFATVLVASLGYLWRRDLRWDAHAQAAAELGAGLTALTLVLGSLWGRPVWGVWWAWDPRLVSTAVLLLVYVGYLGVRGLSPDRHVNARRAAVIGVLGFVEVPIVHFSVLWWRSLHQPPTVIQPGAPPIAAPMLAALLTGVLAFTLLTGWVFLRRLDQLTARLAPAVPNRPAPAAVDALAAIPVASKTIHVKNGAPR